MENNPMGPYSGPQSRNPSHGFKWISDAFGLFKRDASMWVITMIAGFVVMMVISLVPVLGNIAGMFLTYVWIGGLMLGCHDASQGKPFDVKYLFEGFKKDLLKLVQLSAIMSFASLVIFYVALGPTYFEVMGGGKQLSQEELEAFIQQNMINFLIALALVIPLQMAAWFAPALIIINKMPVIDAMRASVQGCIRNIVPFLLYGVAMLVIFVGAMIPFMLGLLIAMPLMFASMYTSYKDIFVGINTNSSEESMHMEA